MFQLFEQLSTASKNAQLVTIFHSACDCTNLFLSKESLIKFLFLVELVQDKHLRGMQAHTVSSPEHYYKGFFFWGVPESFYYFQQCLIALFASDVVVLYVLVKNVTVVFSKIAVTKELGGIHDTCSVLNNWPKIWVVLFNVSIGIKMIHSVIQFLYNC